MQRHPRGGERVTMKEVSMNIVIVLDLRITIMLVPSFSLVMSTLPRMTGTALNAPPQQTPLPSRSHRRPALPRAKVPGIYFLFPFNHN